MRRTAATVAITTVSGALIALAACGVSAQSAPERLPLSTTTPAAIPTTTVRPSPSPSPTTLPSSTTPLAESAAPITPVAGPGAAPATR